MKQVIGNMNVFGGVTKNDLYINQVTTLMYNVLLHMNEDVTRNIEEKKQIHYCVQHTRLFYETPRKGATSKDFIDVYQKNTFNPYSQAVMGIIFINYILEHINIYGYEDMFQNKIFVNYLKVEFKNSIRVLESDENNKPILNMYIDILKSCYNNLRNEMLLHDLEDKIEFKKKQLDCYVKELMEKTWHPSRVLDWCLDTEEKNEW